MSGMNHLTTNELEDRLHTDLRTAADRNDLKDLLYDLIDEIIENRRRIDGANS